MQFVYFLYQFEVKMLAIVQQRLNSKSSRLLKNYLRTSVGKWLKTDRKNAKTSNLLPNSDISSEFLFEIRKFWLDKSFENLQMIKLCSQQVFQSDNDIFQCRKFFQNGPNKAKLINFNVFTSFRQFFVQLLSYFHTQYGLKT